jgi:hypothetical protein
LSHLGADATAAASRRQTDVKTLQRQLRGDCDWITLKAMEKDRTRRYASASELAGDIERYLQNEPVVARPPSRAYRTSKFVRRHRAAVAAAGVLLSVIVGALIVSINLYSRAESARIRAERELQLNRVEADAFDAWVQDSMEGKTELPRYLPLAREALRLQRERFSSDSFELAQSLLKHLFFINESYFLDKPPIATHDQETELAREFGDIAVRLLAQGDERALRFVDIDFEESNLSDNFDPLILEEMSRAGLRLRRAKLKPNDAVLLDTERYLAKLLWKHGRERLDDGDAASAELKLREALDLHLGMAAKIPISTHQAIERAIIEGDLGHALTLLRRYEQAERFLLESYSVVRDHPYKESFSFDVAVSDGIWEFQVGMARIRLIELYKAWGREEWRKYYGPIGDR